MLPLLLILALQTPPAAVEGAPPTGVELPVPAGPGARWPDLTAGAGGELYLSWVEPGPEPEAWVLAVARLVEGRWKRLADAASGRDWFVNWADFPSLAVRPDGALAAHYLAKSGAGTYAYEVLVTLSGDGGASWSEPFCLHDDRRPAEHGFVSLEPFGAGFAAVWLDGRETGTEGGAMALYARTVGTDGELGPELLLDGRVCDCCQTALAPIGRGLVAAYRDRSEGEVRDIAWQPLGPVALAGGSAAGPRPLFEDGWNIAGCPVNGPALAAFERTLAAAWFTLGADGRPRVLACTLRRAPAEPGEASGAVVSTEPLLLSGDEPLGRVDAVFTATGDLWVSWLEGRGDAADWIAARVDTERGRFEPVALVRVPSTGRDTGFGRLAHLRGALYFAWTEPSGSPGSSVRTLRLP